MGTFHHGKSELHGMTLAVITNDAVVVGRCDDMDAERLTVLDADMHAENEGGKTNQEWLARAARFGVAPRHSRVTLPVSDIVEYGLLSEYYDGIGKAAAPAKTQAAPAKAAATPTPAPAPTDSVVDMTEAAQKEIRRIIADDGKPGQGLRVGVAGGGCSGLVYKVDLDEQRDGDVIVESEGFRVFLDRKSTIYLRGVELDYQGGLGGRGFQFRNPNATNTCGCGESFSV